MTVGDVLFLYDTLMKKVSPRQHSIKSILYTLNTDGTMKFEFAKFVSDIDELVVEHLPSGETVERRKEAIDISSKEVMSAILRYSAPTTSNKAMEEKDRESEKRLKFANSDPVVYKVVKNGKIYNRYLLTMPYYEGNVDHLTLVNKL